MLEIQRPNKNDTASVTPAVSSRNNSNSNHFVALASAFTDSCSHPTLATSVDPDA
jgi:hypothetical protein